MQSSGLAVDVLNYNPDDLFVSDFSREANAWRIRISGNAYNQAHAVATKMCVACTCPYEVAAARHYVICRVDVFLSEGRIRAQRRQNDEADAAQKLTHD